MINKYLGSVIRHALTVVAGALGVVGLSEAQAAQFVTVNAEVIGAIVLYALGQGLSFIKINK